MKPSSAGWVGAAIGDDPERTSGSFPNRPRAGDGANITTRPNVKLFRPPSDSAPLARSVDNRVVAGVASGLATRFGIDPTIIRIGFVIAAVAGGSGLVAYAVLWVLLPVEGGGTAVIRAAAGDKRATSRRRRPSGSSS